jgi:hypothetical protein
MTAADQYVCRTPLEAVVGHPLKYAQIERERRFLLPS